MKLTKPLIILAALTVAVTMAGLAGTGLSQSSTIHEQAGVIKALSSNSDALRDQVKDSGETPVAPPADAIVDAPAAVAQGLRGFDGDTGKTGADGPAGPVGPIGPLAAPINGIDGADGGNGTNGGDGVDGAAGQDGADGAAGADSTVPGPSGAPGEPPASWAYTDPAGLAYQCTRTEPFDPAAPTYSCAPKE